MRNYLLMIIILLVGLIPATAQTTDVTLTVDATDVQGEISPYIFGANYGPLQFLNVDLFDYARNSGVTLLRFPAGRWGDENFIRDQHLNTLEMAMDLIGLSGEDIVISANLELGTPEDAIGLMDKVNVDREWGVRFWSVGNEPNLFDDYDVATLNEEWRAIASAMKAHDPDILIVGPDISQFTGTPDVDPTDASGADWLRDFLRVNGDLVDIVAVHRYPFPQGLQNATIETLRTDALRWDDLVANLHQAVIDSTGREIPVAINEVNSHWNTSFGGEATPDSHFNAIWWSHVLGAAIRGDVYMMAYFDLQSNNNRGGLGLMARSEPRPTYYVYQLYQMFGMRRVAVASDTPTVSLTAALRGDNLLTIMVTNLGDDAVSTTLELTGYTGENAMMYLLDETTLAQPAGEVDLTAPVTLPPRSVTLFIAAE